MVNYYYWTSSDDIKLQRLDTGDVYEFQNDPRTDQQGRLLFSIEEQAVNHLDNILEVEHDYNLIAQ